MIKLIISLFYLIIKYLIIDFIGFDRKSNKCVVIYYHSVHDDSKDKFKKQIEYLAKNFNFTNSEFEVKNLNDRQSILITFDDGFSSVLNNALPILKRYKIPSIIFFPTGFLGQHPNWEVKKDKIYTSDRIMNDAEIRFVINNFDVEIASHTASHVDLQIVSKDRVIKELAVSKSALENIINRKVRSFSFPYGSFNNDAISIAFNNGYNNIFTTQPEIIFLPTQKNCFGRVSVDPNDGLLEFRLKAWGAYTWLPTAIKYKRILKDYVFNRQIKIGRLL